MKVSYRELAERYAKALAEITNYSAGIDTALTQLADAWQASGHEFEQVVASPLFSQVSCAESLIGGVGANSTELKNFILVLGRKKRLRLLPWISKAYSVAINKKINRQSGVAWVANEASVSTGDRLAEVLSQYTGKTVELTCRVDTDLLGGARVQVGGLIVDQSIKTRLVKLKEHLQRSDI